MRKRDEVEVTVRGEDGTRSDPLSPRERDRVRAFITIRQTSFALTRFGFAFTDLSLGER
ncbi:MAG: hypothetical protein KC466_14985 [Myxococcales bacterium]|nr:hypothetical protein [Myxococcales bacterium]